MISSNLHQSTEQPPKIPAFRNCGPGLKKPKEDLNNALSGATLDITVYKPEMLIFLDETGADQRNAVRRFGYSLRGMPLQKQSLLVRGERMSAIALLVFSIYLYDLEPQIVTFFMSLLSSSVTAFQWH